MLKKIISWLRLARTTGTIAIALSILLLFVLVASLAACSSTTTTALNLGQKSAMAQSLAQSAFVVRDLAVSPVNVSKGDAVTIIANVINTGGSTGPYTAELKINNAIVASKTLDIPAGVTQTLNFIVPASSPGTYEATFGDLSGKYTVADKSATVIQANNVTGANSAPDAAAASVPSCCSPSQTTASSPSSTAPSCCTPSPTTPNTSAFSTFPSGGGCCGR